MSELNQGTILNMARSEARSLLSSTPAFQGLPVKDQKTIYQELVKDKYDSLAKQHGFAVEMGTKGASSNIDDKRHEKGFGGTVDAFEDLVDSVDFPQFVKDLLKAVFDANISVMRAQTEEYIRLMKQATKSVGELIKGVKDDDTFAYLAENKSDQFNISMDDGKINLTKPTGEKVDVEDNEVKVEIMSAKIKMAQEHRAMLREVLLMGVTRLVVEKGYVEAGVIFDVQGNREATRADMVNTNDQTSGGGGGGINFLGFSAGGSGNTTKSKVMVSSANSKNTDQLKANLTGKVKIDFKTDYFKLDNFATMYAGGAAGGPGQAPPQQQQGALPGLGK
jgi:hypothetical protein